MRVNITERIQGLGPEGAKELSPGFQPWVPRHAKMRPESGARMKRRARMISIQYSGLRSGAPSGQRFARLPYVDAHGRCRSNLDSVGIDRGLKTSLLFKKRPKKE